MTVIGNTCERPLLAVNSSSVHQQRFLLDQLTPIPGIEKISTSFTLKQVRHKTALPLPSAG